MKAFDVKVGEINICQICRSKKLENVINLGYSGLCDSLLSKQNLKKPEKEYPLNLFRCTKCQLLQINHAIDHAEVFHKNYPYKGGITKLLKQYLHNTSIYVRKKFIFTKVKPFIIDIGSNDGTLLQGFKNKNFEVLGVEPTNIAKIANKRGIKTIQSFFEMDIARKILKKYGKVDVITGTNVFAHVNKLDTFMRGVKLLLNSKEGIFVTESHYAANIIKDLQFDSIYHEHLRFFLLKPLIKLMQSYNFKVIDAMQIPNYGGSIRIVATLNKKIKVSKNVKKILFSEEKKDFYSSKKYEKFREDVFEAKENLMNKLWELKSKNKTIVGAGCPGRSITLLSFCEINNSLLDYIAEQSSSLKLNLFTPTTHIKIVDEKRLIKEQPDYVLVLAWHYGKSVMYNLRKKGYRGKFIMPLPKLKII
tara:strand:+ start:3162 stop:4418 length:1257 start_codon:yes stop_codon:yes gene_type:complete